VSLALDPDFGSITGRAALGRNFHDKFGSAAFHVNAGKAALRRNYDFNIRRVLLGGTSILTFGGLH
jgi:hypothetical protein